MSPKGGLDVKKRILFIGTGGTIASEMSDEGLLPGVGASALLGYVPDVAQLCDVDSVLLYELDSTNIGPEEWLGLASTIRNNYTRFDGFVISHGTDTMAYTAAALSYLVQLSPKPIVLTGAQKPIGFDTTDSRQNLRDAFAVACDVGMHGVCIVFNGRVILGTRARKTHSKSFDAFSSINYPNIADLRDGRLSRYIEPECLPEPRFYSELDTRVGLLKLIPGTEPELLDYMLSRCRALVIERFGVGGLPERGGMHAAVKAAARSGKAIVMTTQVQNEGSDLAVYSTGSALAKSPGILEAYDMTTEAAVAKLMWLLPLAYGPGDVQRMFYTPISRDILL
mgnify:FL=1